MKRLLWKSNDLNAPVSYEDDPDDRHVVYYPDESNLVSSIVEWDQGDEDEGAWFHFAEGQPLEEPPLVATRRLHAPVLDLDIPHRYVPSTTPGHGHLYLDVEMTWPQYVAILTALHAAGVIETGFYENTIRRGASFVRQPWVKKGGSA